MGFRTPDTWVLPQVWEGIWGPRHLGSPGSGRGVGLVGGGLYHRGLGAPTPGSRYLVRGARGPRDPPYPCF